MDGTKYLSELVDVTTLRKDKLNIIQAPTGSGKTYFALHYVPSATKDAIHNVVYLIDTINGKEQILKNYKATSDSWKWAQDVVEEGMWFEENERVVVITYAKFGCLLQKFPDFYNHFDYIICDELHSLIQFQYFGPRPNPHSVAKNALEIAVENQRTTVIALTATPDRIKREFNAPQFDVPVDQTELVHYIEGEAVPYTDLDFVLSAIAPDEIGLCYISHISAMKKCEERAKELGMRPICIWSISNKEYPMSEEQLLVRKSILENFEIPSQYNLLIINASSETSLKIKSKVDYVIVQSSNRDTQIQVRGRVNSDLSRLYLLATNLKDIVVPKEFLNRELNTADKAKLCEVLNIRHNNKVCKWPSVKRVLLEMEYQITDSRRNNLRISTITRRLE